MRARARRAPSRPSSGRRAGPGAIARRGGGDLARRGRRAARRRRPRRRIRGRAEPDGAAAREARARPRRPSAHDGDRAVASDVGPAPDSGCRSRCAVPTEYPFAVTEPRRLRLRRRSTPESRSTLRSCRLRSRSAARRSRPSTTRRGAAPAARSSPRPARTVVFGSGNADADLMFVGEAPGANEDEQGLPFVGQAGQAARPAARRRSG